MEDQGRLPEYDELTQCVVEDGKGGYKVIPLPITKKEPADNPHEVVEQVTRPTEVRTTELLEILKAENLQIKQELENIKASMVETAKVRET